jgi:hypothetical protein
MPPLRNELHRHRPGRRRTHAVGDFDGFLHDMPPTQFGVHVVEASLKRTGIAAGRQNQSGHSRSAIAAGGDNFSRVPSRTAEALGRGARHAARRSSTGWTLSTAAPARR